MMNVRLGSDKKLHDAFTPADITAKAGQKIIVTVYSYDMDAHSFTVPALSLNVVIPGVKHEGCAGGHHLQLHGQEAGRVPLAVPTAVRRRCKRLGHGAQQLHGRHRLHSAGLVPRQRALLTTRVSRPVCCERVRGHAAPDHAARSRYTRRMTFASASICQAALGSARRRPYHESMGPARGPAGGRSRPDT